MNSVRFDYALSFFSVGDDIRFQYRLNKGGWSDFTTVRTKEYSSLSEGEYTFEVKASFLTVRHHRIQSPSVYFHRGIAVLLHTFVISSWLCLPYGMSIAGMMSV